MGLFDIPGTLKSAVRALTILTDKGMLIRIGTAAGGFVLMGIAVWLLAQKQVTAVATTVAKAVPI